MGHSFRRRNGGFLPSSAQESTQKLIDFLHFVNLNPIKTKEAQGVLFLELLELL